MLTITTTNNLEGYEVVEYLGNVADETFGEMIMTTACGAALRVRRTS